MSIGAMTMILANVGLQIYNNWCGSRQNKQLQQKREEYERAAREHNTQRMWQLMREGQEMTRQLEEERHQQRLEELKNDVGNLLQKLAYSATINNWPLSVLPIVMKNQALGNLLANQEEHIAMHCILTPSNYQDFNKVVFPRLEEKLDEYCNQYWSVLTDRPVLFYSGAWRSGQAPTEVQIDSMRSALGNLPTLLITPFFRPSDGRLIFQLRIWGVGTLNDGFNDFSELEPIEFQRTYTDKDDYANGDGVLDEIIEDVIPYLQCVIGYIADTYFWSSEGLSPCLPKLLTNGTINTDGMKYLVNNSQEYYERLLLTCNENEQELFSDSKDLDLCEGTSCFWNDELKIEKLENIFISYCSKHTGRDFHSMKECLNLENFTKEDLPFIRKFRKVYNLERYGNELDEIQSVLESVDFDYSILEATDIPYLEKLAEDGNAVAMFRLGEIYEYSIGTIFDSDKSMSYYNESSNFILTKVYNLIKEEKEEIDPNDIESLKQLYSLNITQAVLYGAILQYKSIYKFDSKNILEILDKIEYSNHPYAYYWAAKLIRKQYDKKYLASYVELMGKSADLGYLEAIKSLSNDYLEGTYLNEDAHKHIEYCKKAVAQSDIDSIVDLGVCFATGHGVQKSKQRAIEFLKFAAELGSNEAVVFLKKLK
ncbi:hypothetical protein QUW02_12915 [Bacteroides eggerthii]|uniref:Sel1 repeat family protein n=1 Tax=Bacteroides eggerthii TaxID=28111 RepID=A0ABT7UAK3_9BACE|nr:hypothetical protein [Bacteroides eggerthii]